MKSLNRTVSLRQERLAYRRAVRELLVAFFAKTPKEASDLVEAWWERMGNGEVFRTGLFMHYEPVNTAADLLSVRPPAIRDLGEAYARVLEDSRPKSRTTRKKKNANAERQAHAA